MEAAHEAELRALSMEMLSELGADVGRGAGGGAGHDAGDGGAATDGGGGAGGAAVDADGADEAAVRDVSARVRAFVHAESDVRGVDGSALPPRVDGAAAAAAGLAVAGGEDGEDGADDGDSDSMCSSGEDEAHGVRMDADAVMALLAGVAVPVAGAGGAAATGASMRDGASTAAPRAPGPGADTELRAVMVRVRPWPPRRPVRGWCSSR